MKTEIIKINSVINDSDKLWRVADMIKAGGVVVLPTETVYGIAANAFDPEAVSKIFKAKGRPQDNPLIVHIADLSDIGQIAADFPQNAESLAHRFWPGALTMILNKKDAIPDVVTTGLDTVAIRMPLHPIVRDIIIKSGVPLAAPSANLSGKPSPTTAKHCIDDLFGKVDIIVDGGSCDIGIESTVVSLVTSPPKLLRPGIISLEQLQNVIGEVLSDQSITAKITGSGRVSSPGMKYKHYAPSAKITLVHGSLEKFAHFLAQEPGAMALVFDGEEKRLSVPCVTYGIKSNASNQAKKLFSALRQLDKLNAGTVYARAPDKSGDGLAIYNRLLRAAGFDELYL